MAAKSGERTKFAVTCGLLSQFIKEKGNIGNLNLGNNKNDQVYRRPTTTMSLLPGADVSSDRTETETESFTRTGNNNNPEMELFPQSAGFEGGKSAVSTQEKSQQAQAQAQLTIFYGGKVVVFDNFPAEKAHDLMNYAIKGNNNTSSLAPETALSAEQSKVSPITTASTTTVGTQIHAQRQPVLSDLPIMRKASLQRFLEKRKDRISAKAPYQVSKPPLIASIKKEDTESWLGLGTKVTNV